MGSGAQWRQYASGLVPLARWEPPAGIVGRDLVERLATDNDPGAQIGQAFVFLRQAWQAFPSSLRTQLRQLATDTIGQALSTIDAGGLGQALPVVGAAIKAAAGIVQARLAISGFNRAISNQGHQNAQFETIRSLADPDQWIYTATRVRPYLQFAKVRATGKNWDVKPCFTRRGGARDTPFLGRASPADSGDCRVEVHRGLLEAYTWDPTSSCSRTLGVSHLFYPFWSGAYAPDPFPIWDPDGWPTNDLVLERQALLLTSPAHNLRVRLADVEAIGRRFSEWFRAPGRALRPLSSAGFVAGAPGPRIDAKQDPKHVPSTGAAARWYIDRAGLIAAYPSQADADLTRWGIAAEPGDPPDLGVSAAQHNTVVAMVAAVAARRLATLRDPAVCRAMLQDKVDIDPAARAAVKWAAAQSSMLAAPALARPAVAVMPPPRPRKGVAAMPEPRSAAAGVAAAAALWWLL